MLIYFLRSLSAYTLTFAQPTIAFGTRRTPGRPFQKIPVLCISIFSRACSSCFSCAKKNGGSIPASKDSSNGASYWLTAADQSALLQKQSATLSFDTVHNSYPFIDVDSATTFQTIDGFGYTLTGGSAYLINRLSPDIKSRLLNELFGKDSMSIGISYLRLSMGASDLSSSVFSYDDMPAGQTDTTLSGFSLGPDTVDLIPVLKQILAVNPSIKIIATPWSAPVWMKDNQSSTGGSFCQRIIMYMRSIL